MLNTICNITLGVRFTRSFRVPQIAGEIIDEILRDEKSPFPDKTFPKIGDDGRGGQTLYNEENENRFSISRDDIVLSWEISDFESGFQQVSNELAPYVEKIMEDYRIPRIERFGVVFRHKVKNRKLADNLAKELTGNTIIEPNEFLARISKKLPTMKGQAIHGKNEYRNAIYTFESTGDAMFLDVDYQHYFDPRLADIRAAEFTLSEFLKVARKYTEDQYKWISTIEDGKKHG